MVSASLSSTSTYWPTCQSCRQLEVSVSNPDSRTYTRKQYLEIRNIFAALDAEFGHGHHFYTREQNTDRIVFAWWHNVSGFMFVISVLILASVGSGMSYQEESSVRSQLLKWCALSMFSECHVLNKKTSCTSSLSPDHHYIAVGGKDDVDVYHLTSGTPVSSYSGGTQTTMAPVLFVHGGRVLLAGASDGGSHIYDSATGVEIQHLHQADSTGRHYKVICASVRICFQP